MHRRSARVLRVAVVTLVAALAAPALGGPETAHATAAADAAWTIEATGGADGPTWIVTWHGTEPLRIGAAALTIRSHGRVLAPAREVGTDAVAELTTAPPPPGELELWRGTVRVDVAASGAARTRPAPDDGERFGDPADVDPGRWGPYRTTRRHYERRGLPWSEYPAPIEVVGEVTAPIDARGERPLIVVLHGRHSTCFRGGPDGESSGDWPCPEGWEPIPSHLGYHAIADRLASQGNIVVSISANGINGQDWVSPDGGAAARSKLIRHHLRLWASWNDHGTDPWGGRFAGRVDLARVVLVGHSRGGEGVARAAIDSNERDPWRIRGLVPIGPTAFGAQVPAHVHVAVLLPYCDGDVSDLQGQLYVDGARDLLPSGADPSLRSAVMVYGANHNFFNSEWTPGQAVAPAWDDWWSDPSDTTWCSPYSGKRLTPRDQQRVGAAYTAALVRLALHRDDRMLELLDGPATGPASTGNAMVRATAIGGDRRILWRSTKATTPTTTGGVDVEYCRGLQPRPEWQCNPGSPHWPWGETPTLSTHHLVWSQPGSVRFALAGPTDLRDRARLDLRIAMGIESAKNAFDLRLVDAAGRTATITGHPSPLSPTPGPFGVRKAWARALRFDLGGVRGVDRRNIVAVELLTGAEGDAFVFDLAAVGTAVPRVKPTFLPRLDVGRVEVPEGDEPGQVVDLPIRVHGTVTAPIQYTLYSFDGSFTTTWRTITITPDTTELSIPIRFDGDDDPFGNRDLFVVAYAKRGGVTGEYLGGVTVIDDEEWPRLSVESTTVTGTEATGLTIRFALDHAVTIDIGVYGQFIAPAGTEIDALDVPADTWTHWAFDTPRDAGTTPSSAYAFDSIVIPAGETSAELFIPFEADGIAEGPEQLALAFWDGVDGEVVVTGTVTDA